MGILGILGDSLSDCINNSILDGTFPSFLKMADVLPCLKKNDPTDKANYRPISILPALSKWHECHLLINNGSIVGTLLMDLSKAYDFIPHDLLIAKLEAYGFFKESLKVLISYISGRKQRILNCAILHMIIRCMRVITA
ncbi:uncharacterized protein LOC124813957 [Hydra vulgaris]|uniref:uncharacterized protein LOC124813957 n=1 Tax=Hydra vulgaris TaxID=6087 RepID=UPI001F5E94BC|nr:uncharacterized protein LOC124813957 [Hydra vulgaris]